MRRTARWLPSPRATLLALACALLGLAHLPGTAAEDPAFRGSDTNRPQWKTALAALADAPEPDPVSLDAEGLRAYGALVARSWPHLLPRMQAVLETQLRTAVAEALGDDPLARIEGIELDLSAPPALEALGNPPRQTLVVHAPEGPGAWSIAFRATVGRKRAITLFGARREIGFELPLRAAVRDVRLSLPVVLDTKDPRSPEIADVRAPLVSLRLELRSKRALLDVALEGLSKLLEPAVRAALTALAPQIENQLGLLAQGIPDTRDWGLDSPPLEPLADAPDLAATAAQVMRDLGPHHIPFSNVYPAVFDTPHTGGAAIAWRHHGDSALWTGATLAVLAYHHDLTGAASALATAKRLVGGYEVMTRVAGGDDTGLLARAVIPMGSPHHEVLASKDNFYQGEVDGTRYAAIGDASRDSYTGTMLGLGQAYHRVPALRSAVRPIVGRMLAHLEERGWTVYQAAGQKNVPAAGPEFSVTFAQAPAMVLAFSKIGALTDAERWSDLRTRSAPLADMTWLNAYFSSLEVHEAYYKFNLAHMTTLDLVELETAPAGYRATLRTLHVLRDAVGHHGNPWFDAVWGAAVPAQSARAGARVHAALTHWTARPRRGFRTKNHDDPAIEKTTYTTGVPNQTGSPRAPMNLGSRSEVVAKRLIPIAKRPATGFLWSSSPFQLEAYQHDPHEQGPGIDLLLPWWLGRSHGLLE
jgi:hypothetical protein